MAIVNNDAVKLVDDAEQVVIKSRNLSQRIAVYAKRLVGESDAYAAEIKSLLQSIKNLKTKSKDLGNTAVSKEVCSKANEALEVINGMGPGGDLRRLCTPRHPMLVKLLLGDKVNLVALRSDQLVAMKQEYYAFRDRAVLMMAGLPVLLYLGFMRADMLAAKQEAGTLKPWLMTGLQVYFAFLAYFYLALGIRENILLVNGSRIRSWWIYHHYWSAACSMLMLGLPVTSPAVQRFCLNFLLWSVMQAGVMWVQNHYQRRRMYTRIAMGKSTAMDVVAGETSGGQLLILYPLLVALQIWQLSIGVGVMLRTHTAWLTPEGWLDMEAAELDLRGARGIAIVGCCFSYMAIRNFENTVGSFMEKREFARLRKKAALDAAAKSKAL